MFKTCLIFVIQSNATTKEIVRKTAELLSTANDPAEITTRKIAENAEINPAMVNYYFGSKENLLREAVSFLEGDHPAVAPCDRDGWRKAMFDHLVKMCSDSILYAKLGLSTDTGTFSKDALRTSAELIEMKRLHDGTVPNEKDADAIFKAVCFLMTASADPEGFSEYSGIDIRDKNRLRLLVSKQLDLLLGNAL